MWQCACEAGLRRTQRPKGGRRAFSAASRSAFAFASAAAFSRAAFSRAAFSRAAWTVTQATFEKEAGEAAEVMWGCKRPCGTAILEIWRRSQNIYV